MFFSFHTEASKIWCEFYSTAHLSMDEPCFKCSLAICVAPILNTRALPNVKTNTHKSPSLEVEFPQTEVQQNSFFLFHPNFQKE